MISPGPAFFLVSRAAAGESLAAGLATGLGVATASATWAVGATFGVAVLLTRVPAIYTAIQLTGAVYLIFLGLSAWRDTVSQSEAEAPAVTLSRHRAMVRGLSLSLSNPKIVFFYGGIFVGLIPADAPSWLRLAALVLVVTQEYTWYVVVATLFSRPRIRWAYQRTQGHIERVMGAVFIALGARIAALAHG
ncbi:LysE family translocator [Bradyrhizobium sp. LA7.1]|uniref:LysE family translocator n=1 Tax=Bradyrhizobium sp. LA7.1 TaxID=3156324 RepID=UPI003396E099